MKTYSDTIFDGIRARGWNVRLVAYLGRDHRRMFCADAQRGDADALIAHDESMLAALLTLDRRCRAAESGCLSRAASHADFLPQ